MAAFLRAAAAELERLPSQEVLPYMRWQLQKWHHLVERDAHEHAYAGLAGAGSQFATAGAVPPLGAAGLAEGFPSDTSALDTTPYESSDAAAESN